MTRGVNWPDILLVSLYFDLCFYPWQFILLYDKQHKTFFFDLNNMVIESIAAVPAAAAKRLSETEWREKIISCPRNPWIFFRPNYVPCKKKKKVVKKQSVMLTDKERRQWVRDHWILHHGQKETFTLHRPLSVEKNSHFDCNTVTPTNLFFPFFLHGLRLKSQSSDDETDSGPADISSQDPSCRLYMVRWSDKVGPIILGRKCQMLGTSLDFLLGSDCFFFSKVD